MIKKLNELDAKGLFQEADNLEKKIVAHFLITKKKKQPLPPLTPVMTKLDEIQNMIGEPSADTSEDKPIQPIVQPITQPFNEVKK
jgi:hypothetical protein